MTSTEQLREELETIAQENKQERFIGNESYKNPTESIDKALSLYKEKHPENPLHFDGFPRVDDVHFVKMAANIQLERLQDKPDAMKRGLETYLPKELADHLQGQWSDKGDEVFRHDIKQRIESLTEASGEPIGVTELFYIFLVDKEGNITKALHEAHLFFKDFSRGLRGTPLFDSEGSPLDLATTRDKFVKNGAQVLADEWFKKNIKDDLAIIRPYQELDAHLYEPKNPKDEINYDASLRNQIGRMYHFFGILDSLDKMTPMQVAISTMGEYAMYYKIHGNEKFIADVNIILNLKDIYRMFNTYKREVTGATEE